MGFDPQKWEREVRAAEAKAKREAERINREIERENKRRVDAANREIDRVNRENRRRVEAHNRKVDQHNRRELDRYNRHVAEVNRHNRQAIASLNARLRTAEAGPRYTERELALADRVRLAVSAEEEREWDTFLSYAKIDGSTLAGDLRDRLHELGVSVWFDEVAIEPGRSQALQMDKGLKNARAGIALLTPAYLAGRFWTERELGVLLSKETLIPVLHGVTFEDVAEYSGILPDLAGFETTRDAVEVIAAKIAAAVVPD
jgi:TIR domain